MMRKLLGVAFVVAVLASVAALASVLLGSSEAAKGHYPRLERTFGSGGYVALPSQLPGPTSEEIQLEDLAATPDGAVYAIESTPKACDLEICRSQGYLARVNSDGSIAATFGGSGRVQVGEMVDALSPPLSDSEGRALVASQEGSSVTVHRYLADGAVDTSFGTAGSTTFDCGCGASGFRELMLAIDPQERIIVAITTTTTATIRAAALPKSEAMARLLPSGAMDSSFGGGVVQLGEQKAPMSIAFGPNDEIYTWAADCCAVDSLFYLRRVSASGVLDSTFAARSDRALIKIATRGSAGYSFGFLIVRPRWLDVYGGGWMIRMRTDGSPETRFGQGGVRRLRWSVLTPSLVGGGKVLALGLTPTGMSLIRLKSDGEADRSFGKGGALSIEGINPEGGEERISLARLKGGRVQVLDKGNPRCGSCRPKLVRYRIGPEG